MDPDRGDENMSDADWEVWICEDYNKEIDPDKLIETETARRFPTFERQVSDALQSFVNDTLSSLALGNYQPKL
jgi:hypothetical protein